MNEGRELVTMCGGGEGLRTAICTYTQGSVLWEDKAKHGW